MSRLRLIARISLFSALMYATSWSMVVLPNIKVSFFIIFLAGLLWGVVPGILVGVVGTGLWSLFNPYGPVALPILLAQIVGGALCGVIGSLARGLKLFTETTMIDLTTVTFCGIGCVIINVRQIVYSMTMVTLSGIACVVVFYAPVNAADAWIFKPFWPRLIASLPWTLIALVANAVIFPLLFPAARLLYEREKLAV